MRGEVVAGLTVWAVLIPDSLAYAGIAGVSLVVGLYAAIPALVLYGGARQLAALVGLHLRTGAQGHRRAGADDHHRPAPDLLGVDKPCGSFFEKLAGIVAEIGSLHPLTTVIGLLALALILVLRRVVSVVPGSLPVVLLSIGAVALFSLDALGVEIVGEIQSGLPAVGLPALAPGDYFELVGPAVGVMLIGFAEGLGAAKTYAAKEGYPIDTNRELVGLGAGRISGPG